MRSLAWKLILAFLVVSASGTVLLALLVGLLTASEFGSFIDQQRGQNLVEVLAEEYQRSGGWESVKTHPPFIGSPPGGAHDFGPGGRFVLVDSQGRVILAGGEHGPGKKIPYQDLARGQPIIVDGQQVGSLITAPASFPFNNPAMAAFMSRIRRSLILAAIGATALALLLGVPLARALTRPLRELTAATRAVASGDLEQRVEVQSDDELGELAASFNQMTSDLARARDQRRRMTADIAHELRTPLSVIFGHTEALRDGVIAADPENIALLHDEARRLSRLVEDLRTLTLAESGEMSLELTRVSPTELLHRTAAAY